MKKAFLIIAAVAVMMTSACQKDETRKVLEAKITIETPIGTVTYGEPVDFKATVTSTVAINKAVAVAAAGEKTLGTEQELKVEGNKLSGLVFIDLKVANAINVTVSAGNKSKEVSFPIDKLEMPENTINFYANDAVCLQADTMVLNYVNHPDIYPVQFTGAGSDIPSFFSMHGLDVKGENKHILTLTEARAQDGLNLSFCWVNCLQNTSNSAYISGQRGYMFTGCKSNALGGGTTGRQCDIYEVDGHQIKDANVDDFGMTVVPGQWNSAYDEAVFKFVDSLYINIPEVCQTELDRIKGVWNLSKIQKILDNSTLGVTENPTTLGNKTFLRRYADAGDSSTKAYTENFRAGDYVILRSKVTVGDVANYYYGILQVVQLYDDSSAMVTFENGKVGIDRIKGAELFFKPNYFAVKCQCKTE